MSRKREDKHVNQLQALAFTCRSAGSLFRNIPDRVGVLYRPIYELNAQSAEVLPLNIECSLLADIMAEINRQADLSHSSVSLGWPGYRPYNVLALLGAIVQSVDLHDAPLPPDIFPPQAAVSQMVQTMTQHRRRLHLHQQLAIALEISHGHLLGAVNLCWATTRLMARGADQRLYPDISLDGQSVRQWNEVVAQFETYNNHGQNDGPGDTYYFWTHAFGAMAFSQARPLARILQWILGHGTSIMAFVRRYIARKQPNITAHDPASQLGRAVGLSLTQLAASKP